jgi:hypothetical protein
MLIIAFWAFVILLVLHITGVLALTWTIVFLPILIWIAAVVILLGLSALIAVMAVGAVALAEWIDRRK